MHFQEFINLLTVKIIDIEVTDFIIFRNNILFIVFL